MDNPVTKLIEALEASELAEKESLKERLPSIRVALPVAFNFSLNSGTAN